MASVHFGTDRTLPRVGGLATAPEHRLIGDGHELTREGLEKDLLPLYEQLLATRFELVDGVGSAEGQVTLSRGEVDCVLAQLDSAIIATRDMVSSAIRNPEEPARVFDAHSTYGAAR